MKFKILRESLVFDQFFKIKKARIQHDLFDGSQIEVERLCFERGDSVAVVIYEKDTDSFLFTHQFRYPTVKESTGWILEITAGSIEGEDSPESTARREVLEELGYKLDKLEFMSSFFVSPGGTSERIFNYYAEVNSRDKVSSGGGLLSENENIQLVKLSREKVIDMLAKNEFRDAKTLLGLKDALAILQRNPS